MDNQEEEEESKWDTSLCFLNSEINLPDSIEEHNVIFFETLAKNQVLNSDISYEKVDVSFENGQEHSSHGFLEEHFGRVLEELRLGKPYWDEKMTEKFQGFHVLYDPMDEYVENICSDNGWLCLCSKDQSLYHNLFPLSSSFLFFIKHEEKVWLWDQLLGWLHWKLEFT